MKSTLQYLAVLCILCVVGCASHDKVTTYYPPSQTAVVRSVSSAKEKAQAVREYVSPAGQLAFSQLTNSIASAQDELFKYSGQVDKQTLELSKAQESANYWHDKQLKALRELFWWRMIALATVLAVVAYLGVKTAWKFFL